MIQNKNRYEYLRLFHPVSETDYALLAGNLEIKSFKKGDFILKPGQVQRELYFVNEGVQMSYAEPETKLHVIAFTYAPGICAVPGSFSFQSPSNCFVTCLSDTEMECLSYDALQAIMEQSREIERLFRKMTEAILAGIVNRHIELHALSMEERFKSFCKRSPHLLQLVPHKYIASYLNIDPTNFSKLFNKVKI